MRPNGKRVRTSRSTDQRHSSVWQGVLTNGTHIASCTHEAVDEARCQWTSARDGGCTLGLRQGDRGVQEGGPGAVPTDKEARALALVPRTVAVVVRVAVVPATRLQAVSSSAAVRGHAGCCPPHLAPSGNRI